MLSLVNLLLAVGSAAVRAARVSARSSAVALRVRAGGSLPLLLAPAGALANRTVAVRFSRCRLSRSAMLKLMQGFRFEPAPPNPSVERTANGGLRLFAPQRPVPPLPAAHLKR